MKEKCIIILLAILSILVFIVIFYLIVAAVKWDIEWISNVDSDFRFLFVLCTVLPIVIGFCCLDS